MMANRVKDGTSETAEPSPKSKGTRRTTGSRARDGVTKAYASAKDKAVSAYGSARERTSSAYDSARTRASETRQRAATALEDNPAAALVGGLALGVIIGALLPRSRREEELLSGVGERINETSRRVADAARDQARETLDGYGINADAALNKVSAFFDNASKAASSIGWAASGAVQKRR